MSGPRLSLPTLRAWFSASPGALVAVDDAGAVMLANARAGRLFGYTAEQLRGLAATRLLAGRWPRPRRANGASSRATSREATAVSRRGRRFPVEVELQPIMLGHRSAVVAAFRDISRTRRFRDAVARARRDNYVSIISRLALVAPDHKLAIQRMLDLATSALELPALALLATDRRQREMQVHTTTGLTGTRAEVLDAVTHDPGFADSAWQADGHRLSTLDDLPEATATRLRKRLATAGFRNLAMLPLSGRSSPLGLLVALTRTSRKLDPERLQFLQSIANLLASAVQRSRAEEQLAHIQRLDAIGQLTGGIAHDFNNLLTVISGNLQLLEAELADRKDVQDSIADALRAVDRGSALTRRLLTFARRQPLQPRAVVPQPLLEELAHMLRRTLGETIAISVDCPPEIPDLYADPNELDTALVNLALNARDAMPHGGQLAVSARELALRPDNGWKIDAGNYVALAVRDTGTGMSPDVQAHAIEPFFTTKGAGKGSGLGLSMVYGFATQSGGVMTIDSRLGYGTRVELLLPAAPAGARPDTVAVAPGTTRPAHQRTILVVEDQRDVRTIAARFLRALGYQVLAAADAREAQALLTAHPEIDLLFSDVVLGNGPDGVDLADAARRLRPRIGVLLTSGYPAGDDPGHSRTQAYPLLRKPYRREQLLDAVRRALDAT